MKPKIIRKTLYKKVDDWICSIDDADVRKLVRKNTIVTGGSIASFLLKEPVNDYDIYFKDKETLLAVCDYYASKMGSHVKVVDHDTVDRSQVVKKDDITDDFDLDNPLIEGQDIPYLSEKGSGRVSMFIKSCGVAGSLPSTDEEDEAINLGDLAQAEKTEEAKAPYSVVFISENAITLSNKVQIIVRFYGNPEEIHENYDYVHAMNYYDHNKYELVLKQEALESLLSKTLVYRGSLYPLCSVIRARKFINRGWRISAGQLLKMCFQISELNLRDIGTLRDQLTGVDAAYFMQIINVLQTGDREIDATYVAEVVDRIFND